MKKILITGATGSIGKKLVNKLSADGHQLTIFTRDINKAKEIVPEANEFVEWNYKHPEKWKSELEEKDIIIHLAGANLGDRRWNASFKEKAYNSRVLSTKNLVSAINSLKIKPQLFISPSAVGYYGDRGEELLTETSAPANDFLAKLCIDWENETAEVENSGIRRVSVRTGLVLSKNEGLIKKFYLPFKLFVGGPLGNGEQWFPWLHIDDIVNIYSHIIYNDNIKGPLNAASPGIVRMNEFANVLGKVLKRPSFFKVPKFALRIIAGELGEHAIDSQRISVEKLLNSGYKFKYGNLEEALTDLFK